VTAVVAAFFMLLAPRLVLSETGVMAACLCGACLGFLLYNHHPAKVFMGDTGSLALGGALAALAAVSCVEWALPIAGGIYVAEALSVIIQVFVFKTQNGRRFFRMAPLHHHFELGGWDEEKVVKVFTLVTAALCIVAYIGIMTALKRAA
jgi:phospho-N-acetylmuramoyl-pentapeptide-transferase